MSDSAPSIPPERFYVTTPIYYVNARPHIGHAYTTIVADVIARRQRLLLGKENVHFLTGTDEHGQKIERSAAAAGIPPKDFADQVSKQFQTLWNRMGITYDDYIRTTEPRHLQGAQKFFATLYERGYIYLDSYTGAYCVSDESFVDVPAGTPCPDCGRITETVTEENFFFKLSAFQLPLLNLIESGALKIENEARRNEVLSFLGGAVIPFICNGEKFDAQEFDRRVTLAQEEGRVSQTLKGSLYVPGALKDLSVSRSSFTWGIPVPEPAASKAAQKHVIYVWLDALANYMTAIGYGTDTPDAEAMFAKFWPADLHLVGKEIIRFHCVYWPAFLLALNPALQHAQDAPVPLLSPEEHGAWAKKWLPKAITAHGWLLFQDSKMSKSKGNIVRTETILDAFGDHVYGKQFPESTKAERDLFASDVLRYFLLREIPFGQDGSFSFDALLTRYNADLANGYGNLVSRTLNLIHQNFDGQVPDRPDEDRYSFETARAPEVLAHNLDTFNLEMNRHKFHFAIEYLLEHIAGLDRLMTAEAPWKLVKSPEGMLRAGELLANVAENLRIHTALLYVVLPFTMAKVWEQLGLGDINEGAVSGELNKLEWGGLQPGTKLGPLAPIFPRADKGLAQIMIDMEANNAAASTPLNVAVPSTATSSTGTTVTQPSTAAAAQDLAGSLAIAPAVANTLEAPSATSGDAVATASAAAPAETIPQIGIDDFMKVELRVAKVLVAERIPKADKLLRLEVDLGYEKRQILSGIAEWYTPEELIGRKIVIVANLAPRKMRGLESHGMLLAASGEDHGKPVLATFGDDIELGARVR